MHSSQIIFGTLLILVLLALAGYYAWRQVQTLRGLSAAEELAPEEHQYLRRRSWRRLIGSGLMIVLAVLLGGMMLFLEGPAQELTDFSAAARNQGEEPQLTPEQRRLRTLYTCWVIGLLLCLLAMLTMAALDILATRRFGLRQFRRIQADRRAMIERQAARIRQQRNGPQ